MVNEKRLFSVDNAISHYKALANIAWNKKVSPASWADAYEEFIEYLENPQPWMPWKWCMGGG